MFWSKNKKNRYTPVNPSFTIRNWGLSGYLIHGHVFLMFWDSDGEKSGPSCSLLCFLLFYVLVMIFVPFAPPDHRLLVPFSSRAIDAINLHKHFLDFIAEAMNS